MTVQHVLLVEDHDLLGEALSDAMTARGIPNVLAVNGAHALDLLKSVNVNTVVSDLDLPDTDGKKLHAAIMMERPDLAGRYIVMSGGSPSTELWRWFMSMPIRIHKPFHNRDLINLVQSLG